MDCCTSKSGEAGVDYSGKQSSIDYYESAPDILIDNDEETKELSNLLETYVLS